MQLSLQLQLNFQLFSSHLVCIVGPIGHLKPVQSRTICRGALKFATQISYLLNYSGKFVWLCRGVSPSRFWLHPYLQTICEFQTSKGLEMLMYCPHKYKESEGKYWSPIKSKLDLQSRPFASKASKEAENFIKRNILPYTVRKICLLQTLAQSSHLRTGRILVSLH